jgi:hypothetical protein
MKKVTETKTASDLFNDVVSNAIMIITKPFRKPTFTERFKLDHINPGKSIPALINSITDETERLFTSITPDHPFTPVNKGDFLNHVNINLSTFYKNVCQIEADFYNMQLDEFCKTHNQKMP